jgi:hypothetical protein
MQQQQLLQRLHGSANKSSSGADPAAYVLSTPDSPPASTTREALMAPPLLASSTATLRDVIIEQTARQRSNSPQPRGRGNNTSAGGAKGSDPPGHYLGGSNGSIVVATPLANHAPDPDAMRGSQVAATHQQQSSASSSSSSSASPANVPTASTANVVAGAAAVDPDHSSASASTSTSLQLFIRDPAQVSQLVSHQTIVTLETKDSKLKAKRFGSRGNDYDDEDASDDDEGAPGDDMSIFSELWGSSVNVSAKVEEDKAVAHASNPNLQFDLTSPNKTSPSKENRRPPKKTKSESSGKSMMRSLSDLLEANMGNLLDSPDRPKRRPPRNLSPDRNSPKEKQNKNLLWDGTHDDDDDDACSLLLDDENGQKACSSLAAVKDDATVAPRNTKESNGTGQFGKIKDAGVSLFKSPSQWLKSPVSAQVRPHIPPPPQPQPEQAPIAKVQPNVGPATVRGDSPETSETMATFDLSLTENSNVAAVKPGTSARKEPSKKAAKAIPSLGTGIDENLTAFSSILDANSELTKVDTPGFTKFVDSKSNANLKSTSKVSRFPHFGRPALSNPLSGVLSSAQRVFRPRRGLSSAEPSTPSPKPKRSVVNCYDMRGFDDEY